jgi:hypothetical protein
LKQLSLLLLMQMYGKCWLQQLKALFLCVEIERPQCGE